MLLSVDEFLALGALQPFEKLRQKVDFVDTMMELADSSTKYVFFSHQWTAVDHPDHTNAQYKVMVAACMSMCMSMAMCMCM